MEKQTNAFIDIFSYIVVLSLIVGIAVQIYPGWSVIGNFLDTNLRFSQDAPAWVQAVGSVLAIFVAIWVPWNQNRLVQIKEKEVEKKNAQLYSLELIHSLKLVESGLGGLISAINSLGVRPSDSLLKYMLAAVDSLVVPDFEDIKNLGLLNNDLQLSLIQMSAKWKAARSTLYLTTESGASDEAIKRSLSKLADSFTAIREAAKDAIENLDDFLIKKCGMNRKFP